MCGILGYVDFHNYRNKKIDFSQGIKFLSTRGPNYCGVSTFFLSQGIMLLGHTRLSIIDLSPAGHQPMDFGEGRYTIVFNGEIYNYRELRKELESIGLRFRSDSDTEVLLGALAQWGLESLPRLVGMFAFALYDKIGQTLTLARDAFGIKPLFYRQQGKTFAFASEVPALVALSSTPPKIDQCQAWNYLQHGAYDQNADTFFESIRHLPPGHWMQINLESGRLVGPARWWWPPIEENKNISFQDAASHLRELFLKSVRLHLRSDVPLGAALSGGIDSSAVVCAMRYLEPEMPIHTFTYVARGSAVDEERWADIVNQHVGAIAHKVMVDPGDLLADMDDMIGCQGEPFGSTSIYAQYRVFRKVREEGVVVTLDGQGADEMLAGYPGYPIRLFESLMERNDAKALETLIKAWPEFKAPTGRARWKKWLRKCSPAWLRTLRRKILKRERPAWVRFVPDKSGSGHNEFIFPKRDPQEGFGRRLVEELRENLAGRGLAALLRHGDRNSMRFSVESRVPFLTTEIAEFLLSLPEKYILSPEGETKSVFRAAMRGIVPDAILDRRDKIGFETPERSILQSNRDKLNEWLENLETIPFVDAGKCRQEMEEVLSGRKPFSFMPWRVINYCRWVKINTSLNS
jgi:asparagine synthase (glutamine-hydrolysing)